MGYVITLKQWCCYSRRRHCSCSCWLLSDCN